jgi:hypothetical protein
MGDVSMQSAASPNAMDVSPVPPRHAATEPAARRPPSFSALFQTMATHQPRALSASPSVSPTTSHARSATSTGVLTARNFNADALSHRPLPTMTLMPPPKSNRTLGVSPSLDSAVPTYKLPAARDGAIRAKKSSGERSVCRLRLITVSLTPA